MEVINLASKLATFEEPYVPKVVAALNGQLVKVVKFEGPYVWHHHENEDEMFLVIDGTFDLELRDRTLHLRRGELCVVPRGVEHRPVAHGLCQVLLFEPESVRSTGNIDDAHTIEASALERI